MKYLHKFLRAIGFSDIKTNKELRELLKEIVKSSDERFYTTLDENSMFAEFSKDFAENMGIAVRGEFGDENQFMYDYYFPYFRGDEITTEEDISIERHAEKESYAGICDDVKVGVSLIFYLQNVIPYLKIQNADRLPMKGTTLTITGLSNQGTIMMPICKNELQKKKIKRADMTRNQLLAAARKGDEEAIESLTLEDMDTYTVISKKIQKEDVFSLVDTYFMPYGVECDQYSILGEITSYQTVKNKITGEEIYQMKINCNDLLFDICVNKLDIFGEPEIGRRYKGNVWLQGFINFPDGV